jgi:putative N6-adenine-specific DNA methylase
MRWPTNSGTHLADGRMSIPRTPDLWINLHVEKDRGTISVDTSGGSLHRRGYRTRSGDAPMQETVAAAMVRLSEWDGRVPLVDPMCGSGTLVPSKRPWPIAEFLPAIFAVGSVFSSFPTYDPQVWQTVKDEADGRIRKMPDR